MGDALTRLHWHPPHPLQTSFVFLSRSSVDHSNASKPRRRALKVISALPAAIVLAACSKRRQPMLVASHVWPGYELMFLAQREGWLDTQLVGLVDTQSATQSMQALEARQVDAAALTLDETLILVDRGVDLRVVLVFNLSSGADAVLGKPGVGSLAEIAGKRVGVEDTAAGALMLHKMLDAAGLSANAIEVVPLTIDQHLDAWQAGMIDVLVSYEPVTGVLLRQGASLLFDSSAIPDKILDVLAIRAEVLDTRHGRRATSALIDAHFRALQHLQLNPADAGYRLAQRLGITGPEALQSYRGLVLPDEYANRQLLSGGGVIRAVTEISQILLEQGRISSAASSDIADARFLPRANGGTHP